jgi:hypothetical protein
MKTSSWQKRWIRFIRTGVSPKNFELFGMKRMEKRRWWRQRFAEEMASSSSASSLAVLASTCFVDRPKKYRYARTIVGAICSELRHAVIVENEPLISPITTMPKAKYGNTHS